METVSLYQDSIMDTQVFQILLVHIYGKKGTRNIAQEERLEATGISKSVRCSLEKEEKGESPAEVYVLGF